MFRELLRLLVLLVFPLALTAESAPSAPPRVHALKITILSTMLADGPALGEWGFAALVEADGHRLLFDTGTHTDVVLRNTQALGVDLTNVPEVILSHFHNDHTGGLLALRQSVLPKTREALGTVHVGEGIFASRPEGPDHTEGNPMLLVRPQFEATGGKFVVHGEAVELHPGIWLTGPIPRTHPERNWSGDGHVVTAHGLAEDNVPEDSALVIDTDAGLVVLTGCGHAGVLNTLEFAQKIARPAKVHALIGGLHLFNASEETLRWTVAELRPFGVQHLIGAHCTGIETVYRLRHDLGLDRAHAIVGASFELGKGIEPGYIAR